MFKLFLVALITIFSFTKVSGECANACSGHGQCTSYDMCICHKDWQGNDCSERVCQFGRAHVDTPLGDLNSDGVISKTKVVVNDIVYPFGVAEAFPLMQDTSLRQIDETAHDYMECSNKGTCDRTSGDCVCFDGYEGSACQRTICPNSCSGHGICLTKAELAIADYGNEYTLWDKDVSVGCKCDAGYEGTDCSQRVCKYNVDPLYLDDSATVKYPEFNFGILTTKATIADITGNWAIRFFDHQGEDWLTAGIAAHAECDAVKKALEDLPNNVIPKGSVICYRQSKQDQLEYAWSSTDSNADGLFNNPYKKRPFYVQHNLSIWDAETSLLGTGEGELSRLIGNITIELPGSVQHQTGTTKLSGDIYTLMFTKNPGAIKQPEIEIYLDGTQPSLGLKSKGAKSKLITKVWTDGSQGEDDDHFADHCSGVSVKVLKKLVNGKIVTYLGGLTDATKVKLKICLGGADFDSSNNVEVYNWDYGSESYPHFIKLVRAVTTSLDGSSYVALYYNKNTAHEDGSTQAKAEYQGNFILLNPYHSPDFYATDWFEVYTTTGTLALTTKSSSIAVSFGSQYFYAKNYSYEENTATYDGDLSCETAKFPTTNHTHCLNKEDLFTVLNWGQPELNTPFLNLYTAKNLFTQTFSFYNQSGAGRGGGQHYMTHVIKADLSSNWGITNVDREMASPPSNFIQTPYRVYKFFPNAISTYNYVNECSNRGLCARDTGLCTCFAGYTGDDCSIQDILSV